MRLIVVSAILVSCGCGDSRRAGGFVIPSPTAPAAPVIEVSTTYLVQGWVSRTDVGPCRECTVEIVDGPLAGTTTQTTAGRFSFRVPNDIRRVTLRASGADLRGVEDKVAGEGVGYFPNLYVTSSVTPPLSLTGKYTVQIDADPLACASISASARRRTYDVMVESGGFMPQYKFEARALNEVERFDMFLGVSGNHVAAGFWHWQDESDGIIDRLDTETGETLKALVWSPASQPPDGSSWVLPLSGTVTWCATATSSCARCESTRHLLTMTRR